MDIIIPFDNEKVNTKTPFLTEKCCNSAGFESNNHAGKNSGTEVTMSINNSIYNLLKSRRTIRKFTPQPLSSEQLARYIDAARVAPSGANIQPLKYIAVHSKSMAEKVFPLVKWAGYLAPNYNPKDNEHPAAYVAVCADLSLRKSGYELDAGAAVENLILAALEDGVGACWMGAIDYEKISELLGIDGSLKLLCVVALGYPSESPTETELEDGNIKYYIGNDGELRVPKRPLDDILIKML